MSIKRKINECDILGTVEIISKAEKSRRDLLWVTPGFNRGRSKRSMKRTPEVFPGNNNYTYIQGELLRSFYTYGCTYPPNEFGGYAQVTPLEFIHMS